MRSLPNVNFSRSEIDNLLLREIFAGGEAFICFSDDRRNVFKLFHNLESEELSLRRHNSYDIVPMSLNKEEKLKRLYEMQLLYCALPTRTVCMDGVLVGYEMDFIPDVVSLPRVGLSRQDLIYFLSRSKDILRYYDSLDITHGDVWNRNILINKRTMDLLFCDMDNIRLGSFPMDIVDGDLEDYFSRGGSLFTLDSYMHNVMTLANFKIDFGNQKISRRFNRLFESDASAIVASMANPSDFSGEYVIEYVKKRGNRLW